MGLKAMLQSSNFKDFSAVLIEVRELHLAEEVFGMPVHVTHAQTVSGVTSAFENPQFSTAIGLIKWAQAMRPEPRGGWFSRISRTFNRFGLW